MSPHRCFTRRAPAAFTLVELLVSMVVLILLVLLVAQLVGGASMTTNLQRQQLDADRQARLVFDRMAADFTGMVRRADVDCSAYQYPNYRNPANTGTPPQFKRAGNDSILFFAQADSQSTSTVSSQDGISLVGYRVLDSPTSGTTTGAGQGKAASYKLERLGQGFSWSDPGSGSTAAGFGLPFLTFSGNNVVTNSTITTYWPDLANYNTAAQNSPEVQSHVLGEDVYRLEFALLMKDDQGDGTYFLKSGGSNVAYLDYTNAKQRAFSGVSAIVVTIAVLDQRSRARLGNADTVYQSLTDVAAKLADGDTADVASTWSNTLVTDKSVPRVVASNSYVYQRYFYLR